MKILLVATMVALSGPGASPSAADPVFLERIKGDLTKVDASIESTKELLARSQDSAHLPDLIFRLAELYVEKSRLLRTEAVEELSGPTGSEDIASPRARHFKELALEQYRKILKLFPRYAHTDKVLCFMGHEYQELGMTPEMLQTYDRLITKFPKSRLVPEVLLILGNFHLEKRDLEAAEKQYRQAVRRSDPGIAALARYRLGWLAMNRAEYEDALVEFTAAARAAGPGAIATTNATPAQLEKIRNVRREALTDSVQAFTETHDPEEAARFYGNLADTRTLYVAILEKLGRRYVVQERYEPAAKIYRTLVALTSDVERVHEYGQRFFECASKAQAAKPPAKPAGLRKAYAVAGPSKGAPFPFTADDAIALTEVAARYSTSWRVSDEERAASVVEFEKYVRYIATNLQLRAENTPEKTKRLANREAARAYRAYLSFFQDSTQRTAMLQNYADSLSAAGKHWESARQYERVARESAENESKWIHDALAEYREANQGPDGKRRFRRVQAREGQKALGEYYVRTYPQGKDARSIAFNVARAYYEYGEYREAIPRLQEYIRAHPGSKEAIAAANLVLDSYAQLEDYETLGSTARTMSRDPALPDGAFRTRAMTIAKQADARQVGTAFSEATGDEDLARRLGELADASNGKELGEKALHTLFVTSRDRGEHDRVVELGERFLGTYPKSELALDMVHALVKRAVDAADFEAAARYCETFAEARPAHKSAVALLERAAQIREKTGQAARAEADYARLAKAGAIDAKTAARRTLQAYRSAGGWAGAAAAATRLAELGGDAPVARVTRGWAALQGGQRDVAAAHFRKAVDLAKSTQAPEERDAAAQAAFQLNEDLKRSFDDVRYTSAQDVGAIQRKLEILSALEKREADVVRFGSGEWAIAALYRVAQGYKDLAEFLRQAPVPDGVEPAEYAALLADKARPLDRKATDGFAACLAKAEELRVTSPWVAACASKGSIEPRPLESVPPVADPVRLPADVALALAKDPQDGAVLARAAAAYLAAGDPYTAELAALRAIELDDTRADAVTLLALSLLQRGEVSEAGRRFEEATERAPAGTTPWVNLAAHQYAFGDPRKAKETLKRAGPLPSVDASAPDIHPAASRLLAEALDGT